MLKMIFSVAKFCAFAAVILVLGSVIHWRGHTVSDQINSSVAQAEHLGVSGITQKAQSWTSSFIKKTPLASRSLTRGAQRNSDEFAASERQKLRELIRELNRSSHASNASNASND